MNKAILIGHLGMDPELRYTQGGTAILRMRLATTERFVTRGGEKQERTEWHTVIMWGNRAEALQKFLSKGQTVYVEGRIQTRAWEDKDGNKRYSTEINASDLGFLGGGGRDGERSESRGGGRQGQQRQQSQSYGGGDFPTDDFGEGGYDDDPIPFAPVDERLS